MISQRDKEMLRKEILKTKHFKGANVNHLNLTHVNYVTRFLFFLKHTVRGNVDLRITMKCGNNESLECLNASCLE